VLGGVFSFYRRAEYHLQQAEAMSQQMMSQQMGNVETKINILTREALYYSSVGQWSKADAVLAEGIVLAKDYELWRACGDLIIILAWSFFHQGKFSQSLAQYEAVYNLGKKRYNTLQEGIGLNGIGGRL
jgi:hypothetical protein